MNGEIQLAAPSLIAYEALNALRYTGLFSVAELKDAAGSIRNYGLSLHELDKETGDYTLEAAEKNGITVYDGSYLGLAMKLKTDPHPKFYFHGAIPYDQRNSRLWPDGVVSLSTIEGGKKLRVRIGPFQSERLRSGALKSGMKLCYRNDIKFFLAVVVDISDPMPQASSILGVDLGIKNIATDSDGRNCTDDRIEKVRTRYNELRGRLQSCGTRSTKRHLKEMSGRERLFKRDVNHHVSKMIVETAKGTSSMIAMEDLTGIRERTTVGRGQWDRHSKWAFRELRKFVEYKATLAGVPTTLVNPKNTSRTCPKCLETTKRNRPTRDLFRRIRCGYTAQADYVGAQNVRNGAAFNLPIVAPTLLAAIS